MSVALAAAIAGWAAIALLLRLLGINWDSGTALNPDARHLFNLASVAAPRIDAALADGMGWVTILLNPDLSPLNPRIDGAFYVYGDLPLTALTLWGHFAGITDYTGFILVARVMAALAYGSAIVAVCLSAWVVGLRPVGVVLAGMLFASAPTAFQLGGFGAVDIWLISACAWAGLGFLALTHGVARGGVAVGIGIAMAVAVSSKVTGLALGLPAVLALTMLGRYRPVLALRLGAIGLIAFGLSLRLLSPMSFSGLVTLSPEFLADFRELRELNASEHFPPNWQWAIPVSLAQRMRDVLLFGTGPVLLVGAALGLLSGHGRARLILLAVVAGPVFVLVTVHSPMLRYGAPALPALAVLAAMGFARWGRGLQVLVAILALAWGSGIVRLHLGEHSRIAASLWLVSQPGPAIVVVESAWDDSLPIYIPGIPWRDDFDIQSLMLEMPSDQEMVERIVRLASDGDFIVSSSGRFAEVQPYLPQRFPIAAAWFAGLESGAFCLVPVWQRLPGYPLPYFTLDDRDAQEPWTVYDHPPVTIYARSDCFDAEALRATLEAAIPAN